MTDESSISEIPIFISSINREKSGISRPGNFLIKFDPPLELDKNQKHSICLDKADLVYSWYNITDVFDNNTIKYSHDNGSTWNKIVFEDGTYSYADLTDYIKYALIKNKHQRLKDVENKINIVFVNTTYRVLINLAADFQIDLRTGNFHSLLGFDKELIQATKYAEKLPNITNSIDRIHIKTSLINDSIVDGRFSDTLYVLSLENMSRGLPVVTEPTRKLYSEIKTNRISEANFRLEDSLGRPIYTNNIDWSMILILKSR